MDRNGILTDGLEITTQSTNVFSPLEEGAGEVIFSPLEEGAGEVERGRGVIRITAGSTALILHAGLDGKLSQLHYGHASVNPEIPQKPVDYYPTAGDGWIFEPALRVIHADGNTSTDLQYEGKSVDQLDENVTLTRIYLKDPAYPFYVTLFFEAYHADDILKQWVEIHHDEPGEIVLTHFASAAPLLNPGTYRLTQFRGEWADEMNMVEEVLGPGIKILDSKLGVRAQENRNPSFLLSKDGPARENEGEVVVGTLAWSGSFQLAFEVDNARRLRALCGMNPYASSYRLASGTVCPSERSDTDANAPRRHGSNVTFATPSMIWTWSGNGTGQASRNLHRWARKYGVRDGSTRRNVLLNNWEATYFDFDENKIVSLFDGAKALGMDLFLLDDGWFGKSHPRNDDTTGLGDWMVNPKKLPHGISHLVDEAGHRNLKFGIWVEPEMVNPKSSLFEKHPDWAIRQPNRDLKFLRHQLVLDLTRPETRDYAFGILDDLLTANSGISYVKWDCNRYINQPGSTYLGPDRQTHLWIDYTRALYDIMDRIVRKHPNVQFMLCAGGGGRVDYGSLRFGHEFWPSDNTDPEKRIFIQWGFSQVFPAIATCNHVTRSGAKPMKFAFDVAMSGKLGMDIDITQFTDDEKAFATHAIAEYKTIADVVQFGDLYRLESPYEGDRASLLYVGEARERAVLFVYQLKNDSGESADRAERERGTLSHSGAESGPIFPRGLDPERLYRIREINLEAGKKSTLPQNGKTVTGEALMATGLPVSTPTAYSSAIIELVDAAL